MRESFLLGYSQSHLSSSRSNSMLCLDDMEDGYRVIHFLYCMLHCTMSAKASRRSWFCVITIVVWNGLIPFLEITVYLRKSRSLLEEAPGQVKSWEIDVMSICLMKDSAGEYLNVLKGRERNKGNEYMNIWFGA